MDALLADPSIAPPSDSRLFSEQVLRLEAPFLCGSPDEAPPAGGKAPAGPPRALVLANPAKVSESAAHARQLGFLTDHDRIVMNGDHVIGQAKRIALQLVADGYTPPNPQDRPIYAIGQRGKAAMLTAIKQMEWGRFISPYDAHIARKLAHVLAGGDLSAPQWVPEQYILDLEREAFMSLLGEKKTQERIAHTLQTGKPLRN